MANKLIGNNRIGSSFCHPLEPTIEGTPVENEVWNRIIEFPNRWHYANIELNLNKYNDPHPDI